jgi:hypothetical protein
MNESKGLVAGFWIFTALFCLEMRDRPEALAPSAATSVLWGLSYFFWRRLQTRSSEATDCS